MVKWGRVLTSKDWRWQIAEKISMSERIFSTFFSAVLCMSYTWKYSSMILRSNKNWFEIHLKIVSICTRIEFTLLFQLVCVVSQRETDFESKHIWRILNEQRWDWKLACVGNNNKTCWRGMKKKQPRKLMEGRNLIFLVSSKVQLDFLLLLWIFSLILLFLKNNIFSFFMLLLKSCLLTLLQILRDMMWIELYFVYFLMIHNTQQMSNTNTPWFHHFVYRFSIWYHLHFS